MDMVNEFCNSSFKIMIYFGTEKADTEMFSNTIWEIQITKNHEFVI